MVKSNRKSAESATPGTLMWVGDHQLAEFVETYRYCGARVAQLAVRRDLRDALQRPAAAIRRILVSRVSRPLEDIDLLAELSRHYPVASVLELLGPLCHGVKTDRAERFASQGIYWHQANQVLPAWLRACGAEHESNQLPAKSVAVVAATASNAEPLLDVAASAGVFAVWCRQLDSFRLRNVDVVWWDDSSTMTLRPDSWQERIDSFQFSTAESQPRHAWLVTAPNLVQCRAAYDAGVELILTKPARIEPLLDMLAEPESAFEQRVIGVPSRTEFGYRAA